EENHLRWDSLGEFLALAVSLEHFGEVNSNENAKILGEALDDASDKLLENKKGPSRKVNELDNRGSHFYLALYWAEALANQNKNAKLKAEFSKIFKDLQDNEAKIVDELNRVQNVSVSIGGYYYPDETLVSKAMRPSETLNSILK
ncbi:MAG: NADP-dependent isocitrate dehydrogenase, partial [Winogradskyella sp.]